MMNKLEIFQLEPAKKVYYPNELITGKSENLVCLGKIKDEKLFSGTVKLTVVEQINARGLKLKFEGKAVCQWTDFSSFFYSSTTFTSTEIYVSTSFYLFGSKGGEPSTIPVGIHNFNFVGPIPSHAPYSVETKYGKIAYNIIANLDNAWSLDLKAAVTIIVARREDPFSFIELCKPFSFMADKSINIFSCTSNPLRMHVQLPRQCFELNESIPVRIEMINNSSYDVTSILVALRQTIRYSLRNHKKLRRKAIEQKRCAGLQQGKKTHLELMIEIPQGTFISNYMRSTVLQISYDLEVKAIVKGLFSACPSILVPILICSSKQVDDENA